MKKIKNEEIVPILIYLMTITKEITFGDLQEQFTNYKSIIKYLKRKGAVVIRMKQEVTGQHINYILPVRDKIKEMIAGK